MAGNSTDEMDYNLQLKLGQRIPLIIYDLLILSLGLLGNSTVVYSTLRYNAIKLDKISLIFVQNLAIADIFLALSGILPMWITYIAGRNRPNQEILVPDWLITSHVT